jgi:hypothetical protein
MVYFSFCQHCETADQIVGEAWPSSGLQKWRPPFQTLKEALYTAPLLAYPQPGEKFAVDTDASNIRIGGALSQIQDRRERVIAYYS